MALTPSRMVPLGSAAPDFELPEPRTGAVVNLDDVARGKRATVVMFICNHCPYVVHVNPELIRVATEYGPREVGFVAISSNDVGSHPQDGPERMARHAADVGYPFPYLYDEDQSVARAYDARCTPDLFVYDGRRRLAYRGQLDGSRPGNGVPLSGTDLRNALDALLAGKPIPTDQRPSAGCNIKWRAGNEPRD
ncbi:MAG: thioredoxin family protein [Planctomycetes bacterium]|nr:thioredoxin family protein [Planctomycetota bacterium]